jgi:hypothetical protein
MPPIAACCTKVLSWAEIAESAAIAASGNRRIEAPATTKLFTNGSLSKSPHGGLEATEQYGRGTCVTRVALEKVLHETRRRGPRRTASPKDSKGDLEAEDYSSIERRGHKSRLSDRLHEGRQMPTNAQIGIATGEPAPGEKRWLDGGSVGAGLRPSVHRRRQRPSPRRRRASANGGVSFRRVHLRNECRSVPSPLVRTRIRRSAPTVEVMTSFQHRSLLQGGPPREAGPGQPSS